jgi:hypothetical protein
MHCPPKVAIVIKFSLLSPVLTIIYRFKLPEMPALHIMEIHFFSDQQLPKATPKCSCSQPVNAREHYLPPENQLFTFLHMVTN